MTASLGTSGARATYPRRRPPLTMAVAQWARHYRLAPFLLLTPLVVFLGMVLLLPLATMVELSLYQSAGAGMVIETVTADNYRSFLTEPVYLWILGSSAYVGALVCIIVVILAYVPAAVLGLTRSRFKNLLFIMVLVPFWTSFIVRTYAWIVLLGTNGVVNGSLQAAGVTDAPLPLLFSRGTVILGLVHAMIPYAIVPIYASIQRIDDSVLEAAATLGARPWNVFSEIIIPLSRPGLWAAAILVFIEATGAFITPQLLGSPNDMMIAQLIQERFVASFNWPFGSAVAVIYLAFTGLAFALLMAARGFFERLAR